MTDVAGQAVGHRAKPVRRGRRDDDRVGAVGDDDVADAPVGQQVQHVGLDRMARQGGERQRPDEPGRRRGEHHRHVGALGPQQADQLDGLVGGDRAGDAEPDQPAVQAPAGVASGHGSPSSRRSPPVDLGMEDGEALERQLRVDRVDARDGRRPTAPPTARRSGSP